MATSNKSSGEANEIDQIVSGTRRRLYQQDESHVMINRDKFDNFEAATSDRNLFSHIAIGLCTFGLSLGSEMGITYYSEKNETALAIAAFCFMSLIVGLIFAAASWQKRKRIRSIKKGLFSEENLIDDRTFLTTASGASININHLKGGSVQH